MKRVVKFRPETLSKAASLVVDGGVVAYPTDTVYGLGCDPLNPCAIRKLVRAKKRKIGQLPVLVDSIGRAAEVGRFDSLAFQLASQFWPGPLTIVVHSRIRLPNLVTGPSGKVGLRIPRHQVAISLVRACGGALVGTSANLTGNPSLTLARDVTNELGKEVDLVLDDGQTSSGIESSVVSIDNGILSVLREKSIMEERIRSAIRVPTRLSAQSNG
jgi:L-threonylcarbamoyladenylate synthase